jgi:hypothetical protein
MLRRIFKGGIPHVMDGIARVGYPRLCRVASGEPLCCSRTAQLTTALCAGANVVVHLVLICQCAFPM